MTHHTTHGSRCICHSCHPHTLRPPALLPTERRPMSPGMAEAVSKSFGQLSAEVALLDAHGLRA